MMCPNTMPWARRSQRETLEAQGQSGGTEGSHPLGLPLPEGPMIDRNSPLRTCRSIPFRIGLA